MRDLFDEIHPAPLEDNKGALSNGMLGAMPFADYEMDRMPYSTRFWATIAKHRQQAYEEGFTQAQEKYRDAALNVEDKAKSEELDNIMAVIRVIEFQPTDDLHGTICHDIHMEMTGEDRLTPAEAKCYTELLDAVEEKVRQGVLNYIEWTEAQTE